MNGPVDPRDAIRGEFDEIETNLAEERARYNEQVSRYQDGDPAVVTATERGQLLSRDQLDGKETIDNDTQSLY